MATQKTTPKPERRTPKPKPRAPRHARTPAKDALFSDTLDEQTLESVGPAAVDAFRAEAAKLRPSELTPVHSHVDVIRHNALVTARSVANERARIAKLPGVELARLEEIPRLALALTYAWSQVHLEVPRGTPAELVARARQLRALLLTAADLFVLLDALDRAEVARIRAGTGLLDTAKDLVDLATLFTRVAKKLAGRTPITDAHLAEARELGAKLLVQALPARAKRSPTTRLGKELRDRLFTLLSQRHDEAVRALTFLHGPAGVTHLAPSLGAGTARRRAKKPAAPPPAP